MFNGDFMSALGDLLVILRKRDCLSLRQVEKMTNKQVSNAYLSQIEKGKVLKPSPNIIFALAEIFNTPYDNLMELAGYISYRGSIKSKNKIATNNLGKLTKKEEKELLEYLAFIRSKK